MTRTGGSIDTAGIAPDEVDDAFRAILEGLRTTLPGVQVLFAFLLTLPLQPAFGELRGVERAAYYVAFFASAAASVILIAPSVHQRVRAPISGIRRRSRSHLAFTVRLTIVGSVVFAVALAAAVFLISTLVFADAVASMATALIAVAVAWTWFYVPLVTFSPNGFTDGPERVPTGIDSEE